MVAMKDFTKVAALGVKVLIETAAVARAILITAYSAALAVVLNGCDDINAMQVASRSYDGGYIIDIPRHSGLGSCRWRRSQAPRGNRLERG